MSAVQSLPDDMGQAPHGSLFKRVLLTALGCYALGLLVLGLTANPNLFPTVVLLGSFMVPAAYLAYRYDGRRLSHVSMSSTAWSLFYGGVLGVFAAALLEPLFVRQLDFVTAFQVGLIEEFAKILGVIVIARQIRHDAELDGLVLGAAAGMGFAALESTGYAFKAFLEAGGSLSAMTGVTLLRGLFSPFSHGTWTAILAGVLFLQSRGGRLRLSWTTLWAYLAVAALHGLWDGLPALLVRFVPSGFAIVLAEVAVCAASLLLLGWRWHVARRAALNLTQSS